jgi:hypothetical protein
VIISWYTQTAPVVRRFQAQRLHQVGAQRAHRLHAQALDAARGVVAAEGGQVDALHARISQAAWYSFFTVRRFARLAARRSAALRLTLIWFTQPRSRPTACYV